MLPGMALSKSDIDRLDAAIATSELEVEVDGHRVKYRSIAELKAARAHVAEVVQRAAQPAGGRVTVYPVMITSRER